jgi:hypothetical protein
MLDLAVSSDFPRSNVALNRVGEGAQGGRLSTTDCECKDAAGAPFSGPDQRSQWGFAFYMDLQQGPRIPVTHPFCGAGLNLPLSPLTRFGSAP